MSTATNLRVVMRSRTFINGRLVGWSGRLTFRERVKWVWWPRIRRHLP